MTKVTRMTSVTHNECNMHDKHGVQSNMAHMAKATRASNTAHMTKVTHMAKAARMTKAAHLTSVAACHKCHA